MISFFRAPVRNPNPECQLNVAQIYSYITTPNYARMQTEELRSMTEKDVCRGYKSRMFDYVTFSGEFSYRAIHKLVRHSGFFCFDFDHIDFDAIATLRLRLIADPLLHTVLLFLSPSGDGLKWVVQSPITEQLGLDNNYLRPKEIAENHSCIYKMLASYVGFTYDIRPDATSDVARACYLPYDPNCYYKPPMTHVDGRNYELICKEVENRRLSSADGEENSMIKPCKETKKYEKLSKQTKSDYEKIESIIREIEHRRIDITSSYHNWVLVAMGLASTFGSAGEEYFHRISQYHPNYEHQEAKKVYQSCLRNNNGTVTLGTIVYLKSLL